MKGKRMKITIVAAVNINNGIGKNNGEIPWHIPEDLKRFRSLTMDHHVIFGRKTWDTINKDLEGRKVIVLTKNPEEYKPGIQPVFIAQTLDEAINFAETAGEDNLFIAGGGMVYQKSIDLADEILLTKILDDSPCDVFFPQINYRRWKIVEETLRNTNGNLYYYRKLERRAPSPDT